MTNIDASRRSAVVTTANVVGARVTGPRELKPLVWLGPLPVTVRAVPTAQALLAPGRGASLHDVQQRSFNSCRLLASAQAVLARDPDFIDRVFTPTDDGFRVHVFAGANEALQAQDVFVRAERHTFRVLGCKSYNLQAQNEQSHTPLWPAYLEDAYAASHGGYQSLMRSSKAPESLTWLTGLPTRSWRFGADKTHAERVADVAEAFLAGECVVVGSSNRFGHARHLYAVADARTTESGIFALTLANPQGGEPLTVLSEEAPGRKPTFRLRQYTRTQGFATESQPLNPSHRPARAELLRLASQL